ncbi:MAG: SIMPL domain-containing protein [Bacteroidales bacterium]
MEKFKLPLTGLIIALGLFFGGFAISYSIISFKNMSRTVNVKGLAEREVQADKVIWPLTYKEIGNDLVSIYNSVNYKNNIIVSFLKENGVEENEISISAPKIIDMQAERYQSGTSSYRYNVTSIITVTSNKVDLIRKLMNQQVSLLKKGVAITVDDYQYITQFLFTELNKIKPSMIEEATKNARSTAEKFAKDSDSELGKISSANQGQFSIEDRDNNTPYIKQVRVVTTVSYYLED